MTKHLDAYYLGTLTLAVAVIPHLRRGLLLWGYSARYKHTATEWAGIYFCRNSFKKLLLITSSFSTDSVNDGLIKSISS